MRHTRVTYVYMNGQEYIEEYMSLHGYRLATEAAIKWLINNAGSVHIERDGTRESYENIK